MTLSYGRYVAAILASFLFFTANRVTAVPQNISIVRRDGLPPVPPPYDPEKDTWKRYYSKRCTQPQKDLEAFAWAEAGVLANALRMWKPGKDYQNAMDMYMGTDSSSNKGWFWNYKDYITANIDREWKIHNGEQPSFTYIYIYCDENNWKKKYCDGKTAAYTWDSQGFIWSDFYIVFCPDKFFDQKQTPTMVDQLRKIKDDPSKAKDIYSLWWNTGSVYLHETFHWKRLVTIPKAYDYEPGYKDLKIYGPTNVKNEALVKNTWANYRIADAYTIAATAMFLMQTFKLADPPKVPDRAADVPAYNVLELESAPEGWEAPRDVNSQKSEPDMSEWQLGTDVHINMDDYATVADSTLTQSPPPPHPPQHIADGEMTCASWTMPEGSKQGDQNHYVTLEDARTAIDNFCKSDNRKGAHFRPGGTPLQADHAGALIVSATWKQADYCTDALDFSKKGAAQICQDRLGVPLQNCDTNNNGQTYWKGGGSFFRDCILWEVVPL